jgi:hypothetical protein
MKTLRGRPRCSAIPLCSNRPAWASIYSMGNPLLQCNISGAEPKSVSTTCRYGKLL